MKLTPRGKSYLSVIGQKTLQIYFLHFYFVTAIKMVNPIADQSLLNFALMVIAAPVIAAVLACGPVSKCYDVLINAMNKLIIKEGDF